MNIRGLTLFLLMWFAGQQVLAAMVPLPVVGDHSPASSAVQVDSHGGQHGQARQQSVSHHAGHHPIMPTDMHTGMPADSAISTDDDCCQGQCQSSQCPSSHCQSMALHHVEIKVTAIKLPINIHYNVSVLPPFVNTLLRPPISS